MLSGYSTLEQEAAALLRRQGTLLHSRTLAGQTRAKGRTDFVTAVDTRVQENIRAALEQLTPGVPLMAEEKDNTAVDLRGAVWVLDPVDGTTNLIHGFRHSAISLALAVEGRSRLGLIYDPYAEELFTAREGNGAFCNGRPVHVSGAAALADSLCSVGTNPGCREQADAAFDRMRRIYDACHDIRRVGAASLELCYVACGRLDAYLEHGLKPWDYAAGMLIVAEAGGQVTDFAGDAPLLDASRCAILATNGQIHSELQSLL